MSTCIPAVTPTSIYSRRQTYSSGDIYVDRQFAMDILDEVTYVYPNIQYISISMMINNLPCLV